ncbi:flavin-containing monooxygenase [Nocardioides caldifontis]|uniref:flavin-containing monooxygenase n=1 Tax=Nocardioides caldifontis TaxID=2588938 RepID=UPI0011DF6B2C|nr:NAD(P)/FAD-dependent oxidoreductase [Nocardioides caldifontis]
MTAPSPDAGPDDCLDVLVVGAGQAGLATAAHLARRGVRFLVVDAAPELGHAWRTRWDSLRLFTPAEYDGLPDAPFPAAPDHHPTKDQVAEFLERFARERDLPVLLRCPVTRLERLPDGRFLATTPHGPLRARSVVVATGPFQVPVVPAVAEGLAGSVHQLHSSGYRNPSSLPDGPVVVVGAGNSGMQIALELAATREVTLAVGSRPPRLPQRVLGRDLFWWLRRTGVLTGPPDSRLARRMRARGDLVIGTSFRDLRRAGVTVHPRLTAAEGTVLGFADGSTVRPSTVVWATGFRRDHSWIDVPGVVVDGEVHHRRGLTGVAGLAFVGLPWQSCRGSALLGFVQRDAEWVAARLAARVPASRAVLAAP